MVATGASVGVPASAPYVPSKFDVPAPIAVRAAEASVAVRTDRPTSVESVSWLAVCVCVVFALPERSVVRLAIFDCAIAAPPLIWISARTPSAIVGLLYRPVD